MRHHYEQHVEEESGKMGKGKRVRRQVQYFQPGQDIEASNFDGDEEYQGDDGPAGSDNEYQGATHFYNLRLSEFQGSTDHNFYTGHQTMPQNHMVLIDNVTEFRSCDFVTLPVQLVSISDHFRVEIISFQHENGTYGRYWVHRVLIYPK